MSGKLPSLKDPATRQSYLRKMVKGIDFDPLFEVWHAAEGGIADEIEREILAAFYEVCANKAIRQGEVFMAEELARRGQAAAREVGYDEKRCFQLQALALARSGATLKARELLLRLSKCSRDAESTGLLARTFRDLGWAQTDREKAKEDFDEAFNYANESFAANRSFYNGIQAAQFAFFANDADKLNIVLKKVKDLCHEEARKEHPEDSQEPFWIVCTLAEAALIEGNVREAVKNYKIAKESESQYPGDIDALRKVAFKIIEHHGDRERFEPVIETLRARPVVVFSGHQFDVERENPRLPLEREAWLAEQIGKALDEIKPASVFCSMSFGADLLFVEAALEREIPVTLVLAFDHTRTQADFSAAAGRAAKESGASRPADFRKNWENRLIEALKKIPHSRLHEIEFPELGKDSEAYAYVNRLMTGMARLQARETDANLTAVLVHDGEPGLKGGAGDFLNGLRPEWNVNVKNLLE